MAEPESPTLPGERVFRFISDPGHKENLSGRVRAACLTCRRKKIKCSGEINCATCQEKGLVCEGMPDRKRPRRESAAFLDERALSPPLERKRKLGANDKPNFSQRPTFLVRNPVSFGSNDSGYGSNRRASTGTSLSPMKAEASASPDITSFPRLAPRPAQTPFRVDIWEFGSSRDHSSRPQPKPTTTSRSPFNDPTSDVKPPPSVNSGAADWNVLSQNTNLDWWQPDPPPSEPHHQPPTIQAQHLRLPAKYQKRQQRSQPQQQEPPITQPPDPPPDPDPDLTLTRRQTVQFPLQPAPIQASPYDLLPIHHQQPSVYDDLSSLLIPRTPRTGLTPGGGTTINPGFGDLSPWWDMNGELSAMLERAGEELGEVEQQVQQRQQERDGHGGESTLEADGNVKDEGEKMAVGEGRVRVGMVGGMSGGEDDADLHGVGSARRASVGEFYW